MLKGVKSVEPGYAGGHVTHPTYEQVSTGTTGHIEVIQIIYNPDEIAFEELLHVFFATHDPRTPNKQGNDVGPQYNSAIFYTTQRQKQKAEHYISVLGKVGQDTPIVTTVQQLETDTAGRFWLAEDYHKNYYERNKSAGYCQLIIAPKVKKVETNFKHLLS